MKRALLLIIAGTTLATVCSCKKRKGCTDSQALNFSSEAKKDDGSCQYYTVSQSETNTGAAAASSQSTSEDVMIYNFASNSAENGETSFKTNDTTIITPSCATLSLQSGGINSWPKTLTIDFGTSGCVGIDGKSRKGKIIAEFSGNWRTHQVGDNIIVTLENYAVNDTGLTGTRTFTINTSSVITTGEMTLGYKSANASVIYPDGTQAAWSCEGTMDISGLSTPFDYTDDVLVTNITGSGTTVDGESYSLTTTTPLTTQMSCANNCAFVSGIAEITTSVETETTTSSGQTLSFDNDITIAIDYGGGSCDGVFQVTTSVSTFNSSGGSVYTETFDPEEYACAAVGAMPE